MDILNRDISFIRFNLTLTTPIKISPADLTLRKLSSSAVIISYFVKRLSLSYNSALHEQMWCCRTGSTSYYRRHKRGQMQEVKRAVRLAGRNVDWAHVNRSLFRTKENAAHYNQWLFLRFSLYALFFKPADFIMAVNVLYHIGLLIMINCTPYFKKLDARE